MIRKRSNLHYELLQLIKKAFPHEKITENVYKRINGRNLEFDICLHSLGTMVEVHGQQHYKINSLFHKTKEDFLGQQFRDIEKEKWCQDNGYSYVALPYNIKRDVNVIRDKILESA